MREGAAGEVDGFPEGAVATSEEEGRLERGKRRVGRQRKEGKEGIGGRGEGGDRSESSIRYLWRRTGVRGTGRDCDRP